MLALVKKEFSPIILRCRLMIVHPAVAAIDLLNAQNQFIRFSSNLIFNTEFPSLGLLVHFLKFLQN